ncbi:MAG: hypothetical protein GY757_25840, partial [bacterium]|nr:hypothetical protein [bacterium]
MNFKIVKIHGMAAYGIRKIYDDRPCLKESTYRQQKEYLKKQCLVYFNDFSGSMRALGNEADDIIYDVEVMQKKWAQEHGVRYS